MADANINPIPIHTPTGLGGTADLLTITQSEIVSFRRWTAEYVTRLMAAQVETGTGHYRTVNGHQCHNPIYNMDANAEDKESACGQFLMLLGFTDENFVELEEIWNENIVEHIHYKWIPQYGFTRGDFAFFIDMLRAELSGVRNVIIRHTCTRYDESDFPDEADRVPISMQDVGYDIQKTDSYYLTSDGLTPPGMHVEWEDTATNGIEKLTEPSLYYGIDDIKFVDLLGLPVSKDQWVVDAITAICTVSLNESVVVESIEKIREDSDGGLIGDQLFTVTVEDTVRINLAAATYDRYYIGDDEADYQAYDPTGNYETYANYYVNLFWVSRNTVVESTNPVNNEVGMFEYADGEYFLRTNFQQFASPDEIAYMVSAFSYVEIEEEEKKGGLIRGIIGAVLFVAGAWLFYHGATTAAEFLWRMGAVVLGITAKALYANEMKAVMDETMVAAETAQEAAMAEAQAEAFKNNRADLSFTFDYYDKLEPINPFAAGLYMPLNGSSSGSNPYAVGGEYWQPQTKLVNQRDIL